MILRESSRRAAATPRQSDIATRRDPPRWELPACRLPPTACRGALRERLDQTTRLIVIELYRRRPGAALPARLTSIADWVNVVLAPSAETYAALIQCDAQIGRRLLGCPVVAPSERVIQHIRTLGSNAPAWLAAPFGDAAVLEALRAHWVQPPNQCARDDD